MSGCDVICPLHQWDFEVRTGVCRYNPMDKVATYATPVQTRERIEWIRKGNPDIPIGVKFATSNLLLSSLQNTGR